MEKIIITGNGPLRGEVRVAGAKNAALPIIAAALLSPEPLRISNVPGVRDIGTVLHLMELLGVQVERSGTELVIDSSKVHSVHAPYELVKTIRASILLLGPLLARFGEADVSLPGAARLAPDPSMNILPAWRPWARKSGSRQAISRPKPSACAVPTSPLTCPR